MQFLEMLYLFIYFIIITPLFKFQPAGNRKPCNEVGFLSLDERAFSGILTDHLRLYHDVLTH